VAQLVAALRYETEVRRFDSGLGHRGSSFTSSLQPHYGSGVDAASNRKEYQGYLLGVNGGRCVGLATLSPQIIFSLLHADCLEILGASTSWSPNGLSRLVWGFLYLVYLSFVFYQP